MPPTDKPLPEPELDLQNPFHSLFFLAKLNELDERKSSAQRLYHRVTELKPESLIEKGLVMNSYIGLLRLSLEEEREALNRQTVARFAAMVDNELLDMLDSIADHDSYAHVLKKVRDTLGDSHPDVHRIQVLYHLKQHRKPRKTA